MCAELARVITWNRGARGLDACVCAIGVFDGVHAGHRHLIAHMAAAARERHVPSVVVTFDRDPAELFGAGPGEKLLSNESRIACLQGLDVDVVCVIPFDEATAGMQPERFLDTCLGEFLGACEVHVGEDFSFGAHNSGTVDDIERWGSGNGCSCVPYRLYRLAGGVVTSTRVRDCLSVGEVCEAATLLGRDHFVEGVVCPGRGAGHELGFPTANVEVDAALATPAVGVYAGYLVEGGRRHPAAISVGEPPTFPGAPGRLECHLVDFDGDLYGSEVRVEFSVRLRDMMSFHSTDELVDTVLSNVRWVREHLR